MLDWDFPDNIVVPPWEVIGGSQIEKPGPAWLCDSLEQAREMLEPRGLYRLDLQPDDDPTIIEAWL